MAAQSPVRRDIGRIKAHVPELDQIKGIHAKLQQAVKQPVVAVKGVHHPEPRAAAAPGLPVVVTVLAGLAAEFPVLPSIPDLIPAFQTYGMSALFLCIIVHSVIFGLSKCDK